LCRAIHSKIARRKAARIGAMRRIVERVLRQGPPPTLRMLAVQLGVQGQEGLDALFRRVSRQVIGLPKGTCEKPDRANEKGITILHPHGTRSLNGRGVSQAGIEAFDHQSKVPG